jgi:hypothetical protein
MGRHVVPIPILSKSVFFYSTCMLFNIIHIKRSGLSKHLHTLIHNTITKVAVEHIVYSTSEVCHSPYRWGKHVTSSFYLLHLFLTTYVLYWEFSNQQDKQRPFHIEFSLFHVLLSIPLLALQISLYLVQNLVKYKSLHCNRRQKIYNLANHNNMT